LGAHFSGGVLLDEHHLPPVVHRPEVVPVPPTWPAELTGESLRCWEQALAEPADSPQAAQLWDEFLAADPPAPARANGEFRRLLLGQPTVERLLGAVQRDGRTPTESGLPLAALGLARVVEQLEGDDPRLTAHAAHFAETVSPVLFQHVLDRTGRSFPLMQDTFEQVRKNRAMVHALAEKTDVQGSLRSSMWLTVEGQRVFAWAPPAAKRSRMADDEKPPPQPVFFVPVEKLKSSFADWMGAQGPGKGEPFDLLVDVEGEPMNPLPIMPRRQVPREWATGAAALVAPSLETSFSVRPTPPTPNSIPTSFAASPVETSFAIPTPTIQPARVVVTVLLADPPALFARARSRAWLLGSVTFGAAAIAVLGVGLARRAFLRQLALNEQKSNFVSAVSHELRAPIAAVRLMTENLTRGAPAEPERQREYFGLILQECRRLSSLVENVLDFSRIEQGRKEYDPEPTDLAALTETTVRLMEPVATNQGVRLRCSVGRASLPGQSVVCDARALQQALVNLIDNALKHAPAGTEVSVELSGQPTPDSSQEGNSRSAPERASSLRRIPSWEGSGVGPFSVTKVVLLSVTDHGPGVPAEERENVFTQFYRLGSELRRETQGIGIGLSLVRSIVEAHGGRVWLEEAPSGGCRAVMELPTGQRSEDAQP
jgi:signal transduction histidine kinase